MVEVHGEAGRRWVADLPELTSQLVTLWGVELEEPFRGLTYSWVAPGRRGDEEIVLKIVVPTAENMREPIALKAFAGHGVVTLLEMDATHGAMLLEQLVPGEMLVGRPDATEVTCSVMRDLWEAHPPDKFPHLDVWTQSLDGPAGSSLPPALLDRARVKRDALLASAPSSVLLHADLHPFNVLSSGKSWRAIDPKGVVGEPAFECAPFLINVPQSLAHDIDTFARRLHLEPHRIAGWAFVYGVLSTLWTLEDHDVLETSGLDFSESVATWI